MVLFSGLSRKGFPEAAELLLVLQACNLVRILVEIPHRIVILLAVLFLVGGWWCEQLNTCRRTCRLGGLARVEEVRRSMV
jgi:hypothetical protein